MATTTGTVTNATSASYVEYSNVANKPALISGSSQVSYTGLSNVPAGIVSGSTQVSFNGITDKPALVSSSAQIVGYNVFATTGSNTFQNNQVITGSLFITQNLVVAGSSSIQYISSSVLDIADNTITVNTFNPSVRFGGLGVIDSGSSPQVSGSILFDSVKDQWIFVHQNQSVVTSSVVLMGPETYDNLGNESYISANRLPKGSGIEHLRDSNITDTGTVVSVNSNTVVTGSFTVVSGSAVELQVTNTGVNIGSALTDSHIISGSLRVNPNGLFVSGSGNVGIGTTNPLLNLQINSATGNNSTLAFSENNSLKWYTRYNTSDGSYSIVDVVNSSTRVVVTNTGSVGIGTANPQSIFHIGASAPAFAGVKPYTGLSSTHEGFLFDYYYNTSASNLRVFDIAALGFAINGAGGSDIRFLTVPQTTTNTPIERLRITSGGNVGIGVNSPSYRLVVNSATDGISAGIAGNTYGIRFDNGGTFSSGMSTIHGVDNTLVGSYQPIMLNGSDVRFGTSANERMRITAGGNVGIGNTNPFNGITSLRGIAISDRAALFQLNVNNQTYLTSNLYYDGTDWRRIVASGGSFVQVGDPSGGEFKVFGAPSGAAGSTASLTERMTINSGGIIEFGNMIVGKGNGGAYSAQNNTGTTTVTLTSGAYLLTVNAGTAGGSAIGEAMGLYLINVPAPGFPYANRAPSAGTISVQQMQGSTNTISISLGSSTNGNLNISASASQGGTVVYAYSLIKLIAGISY
jgi:hypothetical protein